MRSKHGQNESKEGREGGLILNSTAEARQMTMSGLLEEAKQVRATEVALQKKANEFLQGKKITVTHERWNGQPHGTSWPKLAGQTFEIDHAILWEGRIDVWFRGPRHYCYMPLDYGILQPQQ